MKNPKGTSFRNKSVEIDLSRQSYNRKYFKILTLSTIGTSIIVYFSGISRIQIFDTTSLVSLTIWLFINASLYFAVSRRYLQYIPRAMLLCAVLKIIGICETMKFITKGQESKPWAYFSTGFLIETECLSLILSRIGWKKHVLLTTLGQIYNWGRFNSITEEPVALALPMILLSISITKFTILSYVNESEERFDVQNFKELNLQLESFEYLIRRVIPSSILLVNNENTLLINESMKKMFGILSEEEGMNVLKSIRIARRFNYQTNFIFSKNFIQESKKVNSNQFTLLNLINDWDFSMSQLENNQKEGFCNLEGHFGEHDGEKSKLFLIKVAQILWRGSPCVIIIFNDFTSIKKYYQNLDTYKNNFLASISHELRTPLNGMMGMMDVVIDETLEADSREKLKIASLSGKHLLSMINNILDFSLFSKGKLKLNKEPTNVRSLVMDCANIFSVKAAQNNLKFYLENNLTSENEVHTIDGPRLRQVLTNLIGNAIKFTKFGSIKLKVKEERLVEETRSKSFEDISKLEEQADCKDEIPKYKYSFNNLFSKRRLIFEVEDTGMGIKEADIENLFQFFPEGFDENQLDHLGTGLGLKISQILVYLMNSNDSKGEISVNSELGKGSRFRFSIYLDEKPEDFIIEKESSFTPIFQKPYFARTKSNNINKASYSPLESPLDTENENFIQEDDYLAPIKVLAVDDDSINLIVVTNYLKKMGRIFELETASDGEQALGIVNKFAQNSLYFDVFLMDCNMPIMDGYETSENLKNMMRSKIIPWAPIVAITANVGTADEDKCLARGMDYFLTKPYKKDQLSKILEKALHINFGTPSQID